MPYPAVSLIIPWHVPYGDIVSPLDENGCALYREEDRDDDIIEVTYSPMDLDADQITHSVRLFGL